MNTERAAPLKALRDLKSRTDARYQGAAFTAPWSDGAGDRAAQTAALELLRRFQADCLDGEIPPEDLDAVAKTLARSGPKVKTGLARFAEGLREPDQATRFEATAQALRLIERQFGL